MNIEEAKSELVKRYKYLYVNSEFFLAPYMYEQTEKELNDYNKKNKEKYKKNYKEIKEPLIYLKSLDVNTLYALEYFLLSDKPMEETDFYKKIETLKQDKDYLKDVKRGLLLLKKRNENEIYALQEKLDLWKLLTCVRKFIIEQSADLRNKELKLKVLDEYFRVARYSNDGNIWNSGFELCFSDIKNIPNYSYSATASSNKKVVPSRNKCDIGIRNNAFINIMANKFRLTEGEKQQIYLEFHDELPWDLVINCDLEEVYEDDVADRRLVRPMPTSPCGCEFKIVEDEIFVDEKDELYRYYQLCPECGYIVNIPKEVLSVGIRDRIEKRCSDDPNLFRKMVLYSELKKLDDIPVVNKKRLLSK